MPGLGYRKDWDVLEGYFAFGEAVATPATPAADQVRLYAADNSGETQLCYVNDAGNTVCLPTSGSIPTGSGVANRLTYWATASTLDDVPRTLTAGSVLFVHSDFLPQEDNAKFFWDDTNDKLLIGINSGSHVGTTAKLDVDSDGDDTYVSVASHAASGVKAAALQFTRSLGTHATPSVLGENDYIGRLIFKGYDSNSYESALEVRIETDAAPSDGSMPGRMVILTTPSGSVTPVERVRIDSSGHLHLKSPATAAEFRIYEPSGSGTNYTAFKAQAQAADITYTLPPDDGDADEVLSTDGSGSLSWVAQTGGAEPLWTPGGRLTLTSATPVLTSTVTASTSIYYALYHHDRVPLYDGATWAMTEFTELTNTTTDNTKNPAAVANNSNYDLFVWSDSGTLRLGRGPAWTSDTARGTGAGTTELERVNGVWMNKIAITNGPAAQRGTYVGTVRSNGSAQIDFQFGSAAANGGAAILGVWNMYNRVDIGVRVVDTTDSWTYATATVRSKNNSTGNRISFVRGLNEDSMRALNIGRGDNGGTAVAGLLSIGLDSTSDGFATAASGTGLYSVAAGSIGFPLSGQYEGHPGLGFHYLQALEFASGATMTFYGDAGGTIVATGITGAGKF